MVEIDLTSTVNREASGMSNDTPYHEILVTKRIIANAVTVNVARVQKETRKTVIIAVTEVTTGWL